MNILIIEDNEPEQIIMKEAFKDAQIVHDFHMVKDGVEAMDFLKNEGGYQGAPRPDLVILDLNMPRKNGLEVLSEIKSDPKWAHLPVLVFSNSDYSRDICKCYSLGANAYLNKPVDFDTFVEFARIIDKFWLKLVRYCPH
jgi:CheY-like chemotaxis protein